jgi:hypothetical protein
MALETEQSISSGVKVFTVNQTIEERFRWGARASGLLISTREHCERRERHERHERRERREPTGGRTFSNICKLDRSVVL